jgi:hypothetical protein
LFWTNILGAGEGEATPSAMTILESEMKLIDASFNDPKIECLYLANNHIAALSITFDKNQGKMPVEVRQLYRDRKFAGADKLKPLTNIDPKEISRWLAVGVAKVYWTKITNTGNEEFWVPSIIDMKEQDVNFKERIVYYFADWKIGRDVDMAIFDHKKFEKTKLNSIYAEVELSHEYIARQKELDEKALALRKKFKLE